MDRKRIATIAAYTGAGALATLFFVYTTFPLEAVQGRVARGLEQAVPGLHVSFGAASPYRLSGLDVEDLKLSYERVPGQPPVTATIDRVRARVQLLPLLTKNYAVSYNVSLGDGSVSGEVRVGPSAVGLELQMKDVDLAHPPVLAKLLGMELAGAIDADVDVNIDNDPKKTSGHVQFDMKKARLGEASVMGFTVPPIDLGTTSATLEIKDGVMTFKKFEQHSSDLDAKLTGDMTLRKQVPASNLNLAVQFKLSEAFLQNNPKFKTIVQISGVERTKNPDGFYNARITGALSNPIPSL
jgi:type II secretion system protein N